MRRRLGIEPDAKVLGAFGTGHISKLPQFVCRAAQAVASRFSSAVLFSVGSGGRALQTACPGMTFRDEGILPLERAALCIRAMDVMLAPFIDGLSTRRGSAIATLQHSVPLCSTLTPWTDRLLVEPPWPGIRLSRPDQPHAYAQNAVELITEPPSGEQIRRRHDAEFG